MRTSQIVSCVMRTLKRFLARPQYGLLVLLLPAAAGCAGATASQASESTQCQSQAGRLLTEMEERYRSCRSYEDTGKVTVDISGEGPRRTHNVRGTFETEFDRASGGFRFIYKDMANEKSAAAIWRQASGTIRSWHWPDAELREEELAIGIQSFSGVSHGTSRTVPSMLFGFGRAFQGSAMRVEGEELIGGVRCFRLTAGGDELVTIWVSESDRTLRKVFTRTHLQATPEDIRFALSLLPPDSSDEVRAELIRRRSAPFDSETTVEYEPALDRPLGVSRFGFTVPPTSP